MSFTSDRTGIYDIYLVDVEGHGGRLTNFSGAAFDSDWLPDGSGLVFSGYEKGNFNLYHTSIERSGPDDTIVLLDGFEPPHAPLAQGWIWEELVHPQQAEATSRAYTSSFALDFAAGEAD